MARIAAFGASDSSLEYDGSPRRARISAAPAVSMPRGVMYGPPLVAETRSGGTYVSGSRYVQSRYVRAWSANAMFGVSASATAQYAAGPGGGVTGGAAVGAGRGLAGLVGDCVAV